jgi:2-amino-4-hydroxy-6-hydroxymethyldihydropteridine diphosphokinase
MAVVPVGIALGSNVGDRTAELNAGIGFLRSIAINGKYRESHRIETAPVDCPKGTPNFLNSVAEISVESDLITPRGLLELIQQFEISRGRDPKHGPNTPRPLDLDILYYDNHEISEPGLIIPHPRMTSRHFVLEPLYHLRPNMILPGQTLAVHELMTQLSKDKGKKKKLLFGI